MNLRRRDALTLGAAATTLLAAPRARAQATPTIRIGVLTDLSGPYRDATGPGSVLCAQVAAEQFGTGHGFKVEVVSADHQNKPDVGAAIARQWFDRDGVDMIVDVPTSSVALAVNEIAKEKNKAYVNTGAGTTDLTGPQCTPNTIHWSYDVYMLSKATATQLARLGGKKWYFITADYVFGQQLERDASAFVKQAGGQVLGAARYPFPATTDFSSFLLQAQAARADVLGLANAGADTINCVKQAHEFGLTRRMKVATLLFQITDLASVGLEQGQGLYSAQSFYWDLNDDTRRFTGLVQPRMPNRAAPTMIHAGVYAGTLHYLKAVAALGAAQARADGAATVARMKAMPTEDLAFGKASIRADGLCMLPAHLFQAKTPAESKGTWDLQKLVSTSPAEESWKPLAEGGCPLARG
ncbi:ABC transporter substrate-binding protein [Roseomonas sp. NAR14]|uniref:ABC transporter substrate-binding protein n=1 Tax=Roseomonas acroporae TaxID=2937791 RepID=A0A9X1YB74_9PROT|nr:ABC transporter substrate-binding protein [Roseomonas acroporae]MCK8785462.1 ABC transporter substrate-binding protein [Roseomonas acroporae]